MISLKFEVKAWLRAVLVKFFLIIQYYHFFFDVCHNFKCLVLFYGVFHFELIKRVTPTTHYYTLVPLTLFAFYNSKVYDTSLDDRCGIHMQIMTINSLKVKTRHCILVFSLMCICLLQQYT